MSRVISEFLQEEPQVEFTVNSEDAVNLMHKLMDSLGHDIYFAQSLMIADSTDLEALKKIIKAANTLRSNKMNQFQVITHRGVKLTEKSIRRMSSGPNPSTSFRLRLLEKKRDKKEVEAA